MGGWRARWGVAAVVCFGCVIDGGSGATTTTTTTSTSDGTGTIADSTTTVGGTSTAEGSSGTTGSAGQLPRIYLNFEGADLIQGPDDDSRTNTAAIPEATGTFASYGDAAAAATVTTAFESMMAPFAAEITTERPTDGDYLMVVITSTPPTAGTSTGIAINDCDDANPNNIGLVFLTPGEDNDAARQACEIGRVMAITLGLEFVTSGDAMSTPSPCGGGAMFEDVCYEVAPIDPLAPFCAAQHEQYCDAGQQNSYRELLGRYGPGEEPPGTGTETGGSSSDGSTTTDGPTGTSTGGSTSG